MNKDLLTIPQSNALRGIAILGIMLHNYCHFIRGAVKENEYTFNMDKPMQLLQKIADGSPDLFVHAMSFFGHYGVPVFLFLSGFGLVMKYERPGRKEVGALRFAWYNYAKLLRLMIIGYVAFVAVSYWLPQGYHGYSIGQVCAQLFMYINLLPEPNHIIKPGPYWYFGLTLQLYLLYRLVLYKRRSAVVVALMVACWLLQTLLSPECFGDDRSLNYIRYNFFGGMLPFGMGMLYARHGRMLSKGQYAVAVAVSAVAVFAGSFNFHSWLWVPAFVVAGAVATVKLLPQAVTRACIWFGGISSAMFVVHPIQREIILIGRIPLSLPGGLYARLLLYFVLSVVCAWLYSRLLGWLPKPKNI